MRKVICLFLLFLLLMSNGGCGGGDEKLMSVLPPGSGGEGELTIPGIVAGSLPENNVDAYGYFEADVVMQSDYECEVSDLLIALLGAREDGGREEILGAAAIKSLRKGERNYRFTMQGAAFDHEMGFLKTGKYADARLALIPGDSFNGKMDRMSVGLNSTVFYTAAGELPVIVKDSIEIDVKDPPAHLGFANAKRLAREENGWQRIEAGKVNGEPVIVAYAATVDLRLELSCASYDVGGIEITENGGALLLGRGQSSPVKTLFWEGPFQSGEAGITFTVMYWGNSAPLHISTLSFTVLPIKARGSEMDDGKFVARRVTDETLRAPSFYRASAINDPLIDYRSFASIAWNLWKAYELDPKTAGRDSEWDTAVAPAYWYANLMKDLSKMVDWNTAIAVYPGLDGVSMKSDFFYGDRPINLEDSNRNRNQFIRIPKVYYDAEQKYNSLYSSSMSPFPFGDEAYLSWWCTLPTWMLREQIFPLPSRSYGTLTIGNAINDDYLWQVAFPMFINVAASYGTGSYEYALFWNEQLGLEQQDTYPNILPSRSRDNYKALFPPASSVPIAILEGDLSGYLSDITNKKPVTFQYSPDYVKYYNELSSSNSLGKGSTKLNAGYELSYSDGVFYHADRYYPREHYLTAHNWTTLDLDLPVWIFDRKFSVLDAGVAFNSYVSADVTLGVNSDDLSALKWGNELYDERTNLQVHLSLMGMTLFDRNILFALSNDTKPNIKDHSKETYPLVSKSFEKAIVDADKANVVVGPVKLGFGFGITGEAGINFNYMYGKITLPTDTIYAKNSHIVGARMELEPYGEIGAYAEVTAGLPLTPPIPPVGLSLKGEVNVIRLGLPFYYEREVGFLAERMEMGAGGPVPSDRGDLYYSLKNRGEYGMDLTLGGLDGTLKLKAEAAGFSKEWDLYKWEGIDYIDDVNIFKFNQFLPLSLSIAVPSNTP